jgi:hypothetical protein
MAIRPFIKRLLRWVGTTALLLPLCIVVFLWWRSYSGYVALRREQHLVVWPDGHRAEQTRSNERSGPLNLRITSVASERGQLKIHFILGTYDIASPPRVVATPAVGGAQSSIVTGPWSDGRMYTIAEPAWHSDMYASIRSDWRLRSYRPNERIRWPSAPFGIAHRLDTWGQSGSWAESCRVIVIKYWLLLTITGIPPFLFLVVPFVRRLHRKRRGLCSVCAYDLRATPDRCPECGTPVPAGFSPSIRAVQSPH